MKEVELDPPVQGRSTPLALPWLIELNELNELAVVRFTLVAIELGELGLKLALADEGVSHCSGVGVVAGLILYPAEFKDLTSDCFAPSNFVKISWLCSM